MIERCPTCGDTLIRVKLPKHADANPNRDSDYTNGPLACFVHGVVVLDLPPPASPYPVRTQHYDPSCVCGARDVSECVCTEELLARRRARTEGGGE